MIEEIKQYDSNFSESGFITYINNIFVQVKMGIVLKNLINIKHFVSSNLYEQLEGVVNNLNKRELTQMYDELNVYDTKLLKFSKTAEKLVLEVNLISRALDYQMNKNGKIVKGNNKRRIEQNNYLTFTKKINTKEIGMMMKCPSCGATLEVNKSGRCPYCHGIFDLADYNWILDSGRF